VHGIDHSSYERKFPYGLGYGLDEEAVAAMNCAKLRQKSVKISASFLNPEESMYRE
jgi:hypothetical protein